MRAAATFPRPIPFASATLGQSDRMAFLRKTYAHLGVALIALAVLTGGMMRFFPETSLAMSRWAFSGTWNWLLVLALFMGVGYVGDRLAWSQSSRALQYLGLGVSVIAQALLLQPLLWVAMLKLGAGDAQAVILQAATVTLAIFVGLTLTVFVTRRDFSFLRSALMVGSFAALGIIVASMIFGFSLGAVFAGVMILLMAGYILYQTGQIARDFPPTAHVAAALLLFSTIATLFWYVLQFLMSFGRDE